MISRRVFLKIEKNKSFFKNEIIPRKEDIIPVQAK
jgi:hypothetical protein